MNEFTIKASDALQITWRQDVTFRNGDKPILTITHDGRFVLGPGASIDEAANALVKAATALHTTLVKEEG